MKRNHGYFILKENSLSACLTCTENPVSKDSNFFFGNKEIAEYSRKKNRRVSGYLWGTPPCVLFPIF